jgi:glutathionyl-hydroquinone reductase
MIKKNASGDESDVAGNYRADKRRYQVRYLSACRWALLVKSANRKVEEASLIRLSVRNVEVLSLGWTSRATAVGGGVECRIEGEKKVWAAEGHCGGTQSLAAPQRQSGREREDREWGMGKEGERERERETRWYCG